MTPSASDVGPLNTIGLVSDYVPRQCGIATFAGDLANALESAAPQTGVWVVAVNDRPEGYRYSPRVRFEIAQNRLSDYQLAADFLNINQIDVVSVQHEYGIFGGPYGSHVVELLRDLRMPAVATLHTILRDPDPGQRETLLSLADACDRLVSLSRRGVEFLRDRYGIPEEKIAFIPHGIPDMPFVDPNYFKDLFGVEGRKVVLTFGLLSPNKGIEYMIDALPEVVRTHPDVAYIILGATHPAVKAAYGEDYRLELQRRVQERHLDEHVIFHNRFVELRELCEFLGAADVYVTPYLNEAQIVSGTLAYALGAGKAVISTPYWYAEEMLAEGRGRIVPFRDSDALAAQLLALLDNEVERTTMRKRAYAFARDMVWKEVGRRYVELFAQARQDRRRTVKPVSPAARAAGRMELPEIRLNHLYALTDDTGILQHARFTVPNRAHGYCTDDNARALTVVLLAQEFLPRDPMLHLFATRYLSFLDFAFNADSGRFRNFLTYDRDWTEETGSEDCHGRAVWGLGIAVGFSRHRGQMEMAVNLFQRSIGALEAFTSPRAWAFGLIGIHAYLRRYSGDSQARRLRDLLAHRLFDAFQRHGADEWPWPEETLCYANAALPHALILSGQWVPDAGMTAAGVRALEWLARLQVREEGHFAPIGNRGWCTRGGAAARFDQQPIEASTLVDAALEAYSVTRDRKWAALAERCLNWFLGANDLRSPLYDPSSGGCRDGLHSQGANANQGAESTLSWLQTLLALYGHRNQHTLKAAYRQPAVAAPTRERVPMAVY